MIVVQKIHRTHILLFFSFLEGPRERRIIHLALKRLQQLTCLRFTDITNAAIRPPHYIIIINAVRA